MMLQQATMFGVQGERVKVRRGAVSTGSGRGRHENSLGAHDAMSVELRGRRAEVMGWLRDHGPATDRQVRDGLYGPNADMNMVRPRISELLDARVLRELDRVEDASTGMQVRRVEVTGSGWKLY
jgi:hypothetical protein